MTHEEAVQMKAAEGYLLEELPESVRDAFEEHLFDCPICAETVRDGAMMFAAGRDVVRNEANVRAFRPGKKRTWPGAVAAAVAVIVGYQAFIIPGLRTASVSSRMEVVTEGPMVGGVTRAEESEKVLQFIDGRPTVMFVDVPSQPQFPRYRLTLRDASGKKVETVEARAAQVLTPEGTSLYLLVQPLVSGKYVLAIEGVREDGQPSLLDSPSVLVR